MGKNRTKKQFIEETNSNLTKEECKEYYDNFGKLASVFARSTWEYRMGRIGGCSLKIVNRNSGREKDFDKHPDWRPLGYYHFSVRGWNGEYVDVEGYVQSWEEIKNISDTNSFDVSIVKHPHQ